MRALLFALALFLASCGGSPDGSSTELKGTLSSIQRGASGPFSVPRNPLPTVNLSGQDADQFDFQIDENESSDLDLIFNMKHLPLNRTVVFEISHAGLDAVISFPLLVNKQLDLVLPAVPPGVINTLVTNTVAAATAAVFGGQDAQRGIILGQLSPFVDGCSPLRSVDLRVDDGSLSQPSGDFGPIYLGDSGEIMPLGTSGFSDRECSYVFFNVPPGRYWVLFSEGTGSVVAQHKAISLAGKAAFGFNLP